MRVCSLYPIVPFNCYQLRGVLQWGHLNIQEGHSCKQPYEVLGDQNDQQLIFFGCFSKITGKDSLVQYEDMGKPGLREVLKPARNKTKGEERSKQSEYRKQNKEQRKRKTFGQAAHNFHLVYIEC